MTEQENTPSPEPPREEPSPPPATPGPRIGRRLVMVNVIVATTLVLCIAVAANYVAWWMGKKYDLKADLTEGRQLSFSERTRKTLDELDTPVRITSLFVAEPKDDESERRRQAVHDLLRQYESTSSRISVDFIDPTEQLRDYQALGRRIVEIYADEVRPCVQSLKKLLEIEKRLAAMLEQQQGAFETAAKQPDIPPDIKNNLVVGSVSLGDLKKKVNERAAWAEGLLARDLGLPEKESARLQQGIGIPNYYVIAAFIANDIQDAERVLGSIQVYYKRLQEVVGQFKLPEAVSNLFSDAAHRYETFITDRDAAAALAAGVNQRTEISEVARRIGPNTVVIEAGGKVQVAEFPRLFPAVPGEDPRSPTAKRAFVGEETLTSFLVTMTAKSRQAAVFVTWGKPSLDYLVEIRRRLIHNNFIVQTWDISAESEMPKIDNVSSTVLLCLVPEERRQRDLQGLLAPVPPPTAKAYQPVRDFVARGGAVMLLTRFRGAGAPALPYADLYDSFGVTLHPDALALSAQEFPDGSLLPKDSLQCTSYPDDDDMAAAHVIVRQLQGLRTRFDFAVAMTPAATSPQGVQVAPVVRLPQRKENWGETNLGKLQETMRVSFEQAEDVASPLLLVAAATREVRDPARPEAAPTTARAVLCASDLFLADNIRSPAGNVAIAGPAFEDRGGYMMVSYPYPGNAELFVNAMFWLAGREDLIAINPGVNDPGRIKYVAEKDAELVRWLIWGGLPALAVVAGCAVYIVRARVR